MIALTLLLHQYQEFTRNNHITPPVLQRQPAVENLKSCAMFAILPASFVGIAAVYEIEL